MPLILLGPIEIMKNFLFFIFWLMGLFEKEWGRGAETVKYFFPHSSETRFSFHWLNSNWWFVFFFIIISSSSHIFLWRITNHLLLVILHSNIVIWPYTICVAFDKITYLKLGFLKFCKLVVILQHQSCFEFEIVKMEMTRDRTDTHNC